MIKTVKDEVLKDLLDRYSAFDLYEDKELIDDIIDSTERVLRLNDVGVQSEQLKCECKRPQFTRTVTEGYEPMCGRCGNPL